MKPQVDYTLYLVTDSTPAILGSKDLVEVVKEALLGGVTVVQYRDKTSDTGDLISTAKKLHQVCKQHNIPLLINDRVDVALAVGCEGVHIGQDDMDAAEARKLLGDDKIIGVTASSMDEARKAVEDGADYLGIGTLYATNTKKNSKNIIGIKGVRQILHYLDILNEASKKIKTVCIGGINASNIQLVTYQLKAPSPKTPNPKTIDGVAIVSAIIGAANPKDASSDLRTLLKIPPPFTARSQAPFFWHDKEQDEITHIRSSTLKAVLTVREKSPLSHNMTNLVVQNFAASVALAIGASPIMSNNGDEATDLAKLGGALVINMGTATPEALINHRKSIIAYNAASGPIVLDPVGAGATTARKEALAFLMASGYFDLIKGNEREIMAVARASGFVLDDSTQQQQRGVDSGTSLFSLPQKAYLVSRIAARERNIVLMTGAVDVISDGIRTYAISNGHKYLGMITGSGCTLGTTLSAYMAARPQDKLLAAVAGILHFEIAAEYAARREDVKGPGTFVPAFVDELWARGEDVDSANATANAKGDLENVEWLKGVKVECIKQIPDEGLLREI